MRKMQGGGEKANLFGFFAEMGRTRRFAPQLR
jgi:hypothetical protein